MNFILIIINLSSYDALRLVSDKIYYIKYNSDNESLCNLKFQRCVAEILPTSKPN